MPCATGCVWTIRPVASATTYTIEFGLLAAWVWTASSRRSGLTAVHHTGCGIRSVRVSRPVATFQNVTVRLVPPVISVRPPGMNSTALAIAPLRAGSVRTVRACAG